MFNYSLVRIAVFHSSEPHQVVLPRYLVTGAVFGCLSYALILFLGKVFDGGRSPGEDHGRERFVYCKFRHAEGLCLWTPFRRPGPALKYSPMSRLFSKIPLAVAGIFGTDGFSSTAVTFTIAFISTIPTPSSKIRICGISTICPVSSWIPICRKSVLPANRAYRPVLTASLAVDYWLGHGLQPLLVPSLHAGLVRAAGRCPSIRAEPEYLRQDLAGNGQPLAERSLQRLFMGCTP